ncbi:MAG TPA: hypothetical protein VF504_07010, partial [Solirubrobacterales bacterium]
TLIHGGPVSDETALAILPFVDRLATEALLTAIKGLLSSSDVIDSFLDRRDGDRSLLARLKTGEDPAEVIF